MTANSEVCKSKGKNNCRSFTAFRRTGLGVCWGRCAMSELVVIREFLKAQARTTADPSAALRDDTSVGVRS